MNYPHVDKGLDLLISINVITNWSYQKSTDSYTIHGNLKSAGMNHKIYSAKALSILEPYKLYAEMIFDFQTEENVGTGLFYRTKDKLKKLNKVICTYWWPPIRYAYPRDNNNNEDVSYAYQLLEKLITEGKINSNDMRQANKLWKKYSI